MYQFEPFDTDKVLYFFEEISKIPRGSGNESHISNYILQFAKDLGLYCRQDEIFNLLIKKDGTAGYENVSPVILQGHLDMVCEKNSDTIHDFLNDPIELYLDGDDIHAKGTTLGADNGIAIAYMMALLASNTIAHPPIEAVFTVAEETGLDGAKSFATHDMQGTRFINMDTEEEGVLLSGCSGGRRVRFALPIERVALADTQKAYQISIRGLKGGHSGADIHLQRANANCLLGRVLFQLDQAVAYSLVTVNGGNMDNAICREADAVIAIAESDIAKVSSFIEETEKMLQEEYQTAESSILIQVEALQETVSQAFSATTKKNYLCAIMLLPYGVQTMCVDMAGLVETSNNIGIVKTTEHFLHIENALRSSVESRKEWLSQQIEALAMLCGATVETMNDYPGWQYNPHSQLLQLFAEVYENKYGKKATIEAIHAGLECGLFAKKIPNLDMVSIGPEMHDVHTPDERVSISSTMRVWDYLKDVLKAMHT